MDEDYAGDLLLGILTRTRHGAAIPMPDADEAVVGLVRVVLGMRPHAVGGHFGSHPNWKTLKKQREAVACGSTSLEC